jgi:hypothetical protein
MGSMTISINFCVILALTVGILSGLFFPFDFGINSIFNGNNLNVSVFSYFRILVNNGSMPSFFNFYTLIPLTLR